MRCRAVVHALALTVTAACGGLIESDPPSIPVPQRDAAQPTDASCVLQDDEVQGFAVDDGAIWRLQAECRRGKGGSVVVREDRATGERRIVAERVWGSPPVTLAGSAVVLLDQDKLHRVRTDTGALDELPMRAQLLTSDGASTFATISGGTTESRYAVLRIGAEGDPANVGSVPATFQMQALAASRAGVFATLWSVCSGTASCAGLYTIGSAGPTKVADWPVTDLGVALGPLAIEGNRAVTAIDGAIVEASDGTIRTLATVDGGATVASIALGPGGRTYACIAPPASAAQDAEQRIVAVQDGALTDLATGSCGALVWSAGELFWAKPETRDRYGFTLVVSTIGRLQPD